MQRMRRRKGEDKKARGKAWRGPEEDWRKQEWNIRLGISTVDD
jgi:hypothetical protein